MARNQPVRGHVITIIYFAAQANTCSLKFKKSNRNETNNQYFTNHCNNHNKFKLQFFKTRCIQAGGGLPIE